MKEAVEICLTKNKHNGQVGSVRIHLLFTK